MKNIYVGNLPISASEPELRAFFEPYGPVQEVKLVHDPDTGKPKGFAMVEMVNDQEALMAISETNGLNYEGNILEVYEARPRGNRGTRGIEKKRW